MTGPSAATASKAQRTASKIVGSVAGCGLLAELGQQQRQVSLQHAAAREALGPRAQVRAQHGSPAAHTAPRRSCSPRLARRATTRPRPPRRRAGSYRSRRRRRGAAGHRCRVARVRWPGTGARVRPHDRRARSAGPCAESRRAPQPATGAGSGRRMTVSTIGTTSSTGSSASGHAPGSPRDCRPRRRRTCPAHRSPRRGRSCGSSAPPSRACRPPRIERAAAVFRSSGEAQPLRRTIP